MLKESPDPASFRDGGRRGYLRLVAPCRDRLAHNQVGRGSARQAEELHVVDVSGVYLEAEGGALDMPSLYAAGPGIERKHLIILVVHHFEYVRMPTDKYLRTISLNERPGADVIVSRIASDMGHQYRHTSSLKELVQGIVGEQVAGVAVACNSDQRLESRYGGGGLETPAEITRVPDFIHRLKKILKLQRVLFFSIKSTISL